MGPLLTLFFFMFFFLAVSIAFLFEQHGAVASELLVVVPPPRAGAAARLQEILGVCGRDVRPRPPLRGHGRSVLRDCQVRDQDQECSETRLYGTRMGQERCVYLVNSPLFPPATPQNNFLPPCPPLLSPPPRLEHAASASLQAYARANPARVRHAGSLLRHRASVEATLLRGPGLGLLGQGVHVCGGGDGEKFFFKLNFTNCQPCYVTSNL